MKKKTEKLTIKSKDYSAVILERIEKEKEGWTSVGKPYLNFWNRWIVKMEKVFVKPEVTYLPV